MKFHQPEKVHETFFHKKSFMKFHEIFHEISWIHETIFARETTGTRIGVSVKYWRSPRIRMQVPVPRTVESAHRCLYYVIHCSRWKDARCLAPNNFNLKNWIVLNGAVLNSGGRKSLAIEWRPFKVSKQLIYLKIIFMRQLTH
jgi:hypothetical protein